MYLLINAGYVWYHVQRQITIVAAESSYSDVTVSIVKKTS